jgi:hypothetical protein
MTTGAHRWRVVALDAAGRPLAAAGARLRAVRPATRAHAVRRQG